jgi:hypothetical protein
MLPKSVQSQEGYRRIRAPAFPPIRHAFTLSRKNNRSFALPNPLQNNARPILRILAYSPPVGVIHPLDALFQTPIPLVFGRLHYPNWHFPVCRFRFRLLRLVEVGKDLALLS